MEQNNQPDPAEVILITHYENPQMFCYITMHQLQLGGAHVNSVESCLSKFCRADRQRASYPPNKHVIVRYQPLRLEKLMRGLVICHDADEYLVWAFDYGFTVNCRSKDLWILPEHLYKRYVKVECGAIDGVVPRTGSEWSKVAVRLLDKRLDEANQLIFKLRHCNEHNLKFGQMLMDEPPVDAADFLVEKQCARLAQVEARAQGLRVSNDMDLGELNDPDIRPSFRVQNILRAMRSFKLRPQDIPEHSYENTPRTGHSQQEQSYMDSIFRNSYHWLGNTTRNLTCPNKQQERLDGLLRCRTTPVIPGSAKRLSKIKSSNDDVVETALTRKTRSRNTSHSTCSTASFDALQPPKTTSGQRKIRNVLDYYRMAVTAPKPNPKIWEENKTLPKQQSQNVNLSTIDYNQELSKVSSSANKDKHETNSLATIQELSNKQTEVEKKSVESSANKSNMRLVSYGLNRLSLQPNPASQPAILESINERELVKTTQPYTKQAVGINDRKSLNKNQDQFKISNSDKRKHVNNTSYKAQSVSSDKLQYISNSNTNQDQFLNSDSDKRKHVNNTSYKAQSVSSGKLQFISNLNTKSEFLKTSQEEQLPNKPDMVEFEKFKKESIEIAHLAQSIVLNPAKVDRIYKAHSKTSKQRVSQQSARKADKHTSGTETLNKSESASACTSNKLESIYNAYRFLAKADRTSSNAIPERCCPESQVLAHSTVPVQPISNFSHPLLCSEVFLAMQEMNVKTTLAMQRYAWPHLMQGHSLVVVDRIGSGRSWCYLPTLCSQVMKSMLTVGQGPILGPVAVLLADSVANAQSLFNQCNLLMAAYRTNMLKVVNSHAHSENQLQLRLLNSCGILVTTPTHLKLLLQHAMQLIDPHRLKHLIIDDFDRMCAAQPVLLNEVLQLLQGNSKLRLQLVLIAQQWHGKVFLELLKRFDDQPLLLFGDFLEAAVYGKVKLNVAVMRTNKKIEQLLNYLADKNPLKKHTLIYCKHEKELAELREILTVVGYECIGSTDAAKQQVQQLLLATDAAPQTLLSAGNFELMIHYSLPDSWSKFSYRFHAFSENINNCLLPQTGLSADIVSFIMLDESNTQELPRLVQFLEAHDIDLTDNIQQMVACCRQMVDQNRQLCPQMLSIGECIQSYCNRRHHPIRGDFQRPGHATLWATGTAIRGNIMKVYDPVHYAIMPVSYKSSDSVSWQDAPNLSTLRKLSTALHMHMSIEQNRRPKQTLNIGDICVLHRRGKYQRVQIIDFSDKRLVIVQQMDEGTESIKVQPTELWECDARFAAEPPLAMDVRLCGLIPAIWEGDWQQEATMWTTELLSHLSDNQHLQLTVELVMFNVVYTLDMTVLQDCPMLQTCVKSTLLHEELILQSYAKRNDQIIQNLHKLHAEVLKEQTRFQEEICSLEDGLKVEDEQSEQAQLEHGKAEQNESLENTMAQRCVQSVDSIGIQSDTNSPAKIDNEIKVDQVRTETNLPADNLMSNDALAPKEPIEIQEEPLLEENDSTSLKDSTSLFMDILLNDLSSDDATLRNAAKDMMQELLATEGSSNDEPKMENNNKKKNHILTESKPQLTHAKLASALSCASIADNAVRPKVRWHQTMLQIELIIEQEVPQYQLVHWDNVLFYQVTETTPPQRCILNLLGAVKILSEQQHGYRLHIKLAKVGLNEYWPSLLNSLHSQQQSHWLVYDTDRAKISQSDIGRINWMHYVRNTYVAQQENDDDDYSEDDQCDLSDVEGIENENCEISDSLL